MTDPSPWSRRDDEPGAEAPGAPVDVPEPDSPPPDSLAATLAETQSARAASTPLLAATAPAAHPSPMASGGTSNAILIPIIGLMLLVIGAVVAGLIAYIDSDDGTRYPTNLGDDEYQLEPMGLRTKDVPPGLVLATTLTFDNAEWSQIVGPDDPELKLQQLDSQKRIRNALAFFTWPDDTTTEHLGQTLSVTSQSTLFETEAAAEAETNRLCGLLINEADPLQEFEVPDLADQSVGFMVTSNQQGIGKSYEAAVCFRTGRIVHGVVQSGLEGSQDIALVVRLAERMLRQVNLTFEGNPEPLDPDPDEAG